MIDEKLKKELEAVICRTVECAHPESCDIKATCSCLKDGIPKIEQAFKDSGYVKVQPYPSLEQGISEAISGYCNDIDERAAGYVRQHSLRIARLVVSLLASAEGELVNNPYPEHGIMSQYHVGFEEGSKAQHLADKATMVKLPNEKEMIEMVKIAGMGIPEKIAPTLLRLLKEQGK